MRLYLTPLALGTVMLVPAVADASPYAVRLTAEDLHRMSGEPPADTAAPTMGDDEAPADEEPAADAAAPEGEDAEGEDAEGEDAEGEDAEGEDDLTGDPTEDEFVEDDEDLEEELSGPTKKGDFNANAFTLYGGIHLVPSYFLNAALASYSNSLCRNEVGGWGEQNGLVKVDGCNFYVGGGYIRRISRAFDIQIGLGYLHIQPPDSLWIDNDEWDRDSCTEDGGGASTCNLGAADYTSIDLRMFTFEINFIGRGTLFRNEDVEIQLGGGGGVGGGVLIGKGVQRTPLGPYPGSPDDPGSPGVTGSCTTLEDTADFRKCTPRYYDDEDIDQDGDGLVADVTREEVDMGMSPPDGTISTGTSFADCSRDKCDESDLLAFGATETGGTWPVYPLVNIMGSFRVIVKDTFGITIDGGFKNGFFFGGGISYFFGGGGQDKI